MNADKLAELDRLQAQLQALRPLGPDVEQRVLQKLRLEWNFHSNAIEGGTLTYGETVAFLMHGLTAKGKPFKDYLDIRGHDAVIDVLADVVRSKEPITEMFIRSLHEILLGEAHSIRVRGADGAESVRRVDVGRYKTQPNHVLTSSGEVHYFAAPGETPHLMAELSEWLRREMLSPTEHPVTLASFLHHRFVQIHPFDDGNGRMARILMNLVLMSFGYPPAVIKIEQRNEYLLALAQADTGDLQPLIELITDVELASVNVYLRAAHGEPIDELGDFDKRLALISQSVRSRNSDEDVTRSEPLLRLILQDFVAGLFESVVLRFKHVDAMYSRSEWNITLRRNGVPPLERMDQAQRIGPWLAARENVELITELHLFYQAHAFVENASQDFLCSMKVHFLPSHFAVEVQLTGASAVELYRSVYAVRPLEDDAASVASAVLAKLVDAVEAVARKKARGSARPGST